MELHTLGVKGGYTQTDVQELARILTGLGIGRPDEPPAAARAARAGGAGRAVPVQSGAPRLRRQAVPGPPHRRRRPGRSRPGRGPAGAPSGHRPFHQLLLATRRRPRWSTGWPHLPGQRRRHRRRVQTLYASPELRVRWTPACKDPVYSSLRLALCRHADHRQSARAEPAAPARPAAEPAPHARRLPLAQSDWAGSRPDDGASGARAIAAAPPNFYRDPAENPQQQQQQQQQQTPQPPPPPPAHLLKAYAGTAVRPVVARHPPGLAQAPPPRRHTCWPRRIHAALVPARTTRPRSPGDPHAPSPPAQLMAAALRVGAGRLTPRRPRDNRLLVVFMRRRLRRSQPVGAGRQRLLRVAAHHRHPAPRAARRAAAGRRLARIPRWPPA